MGPLKFQEKRILEKHVQLIDVYTGVEKPVVISTNHPGTPLDYFVS